MAEHNIDNTKQLSKAIKFIEQFDDKINKLSAMVPDHWKPINNISKYNGLFIAPTISGYYICIDKGRYAFFRRWRTVGSRLLTNNLDISGIAEQVNVFTTNIPGLTIDNERWYYDGHPFDTDKDTIKKLLSKYVASICE